MKVPVLVIDDQSGSSDAVRRGFIRKVGDAVDIADFEFSSGQEAGRNSLRVVEEAVAARWARPGHGQQPGDLPWALVFLDVRFDQTPMEPATDSRFGFDILLHLRTVFGKDLPVVMLTSEDEAKRREAGRAEANGYLPKEHLGPETVKEKLLDFGLLPDSRECGSRLVGKSLSLLRLLRSARQVGRRNRDGCLILGETGSGKTVLAQYIHDSSPRANGPFRGWSAERMGEDVMKDALFGHWRGAHSLAHEHVPGLMEQAEAGTFFLDEIANLYAGAQELFLECRRRGGDGRRRVARLGRCPASTRDRSEAERTVLGRLEQDGRVSIDVLLLTATNRDLRDEAVRKEHGFRVDLFNDLGEPLVFPGLNERREDIPLLFEYFVRRDVSDSLKVGPEVLTRLQEMDWSDRNVVSLRQMASKAWSARDFGVVHPHHIFGGGDSPTKSVGLVGGALRPGSGPEERKPTGVDALLGERSPSKGSRMTERPDDDSVAAGAVQQAVSLQDLEAALGRVVFPVASGELRGALSRVQKAYASFLLELFGAALAATERKGATSSLDALCLLLGKPTLTPSGKGQSTKSYDIVKRLVLQADWDFSKRSAEGCPVLTDDETVRKHIEQAFGSRGRKDEDK